MNVHRCEPCVEISESFSSISITIYYSLMDENINEVRQFICINASCATSHKWKENDNIVSLCFDNIYSYIYNEYHYPLPNEIQEVEVETVARTAAFVLLLSTDVTSNNDHNKQISCLIYRNWTVGWSMARNNRIPSSIFLFMQVDLTAINVQFYTTTI